MEPLESTAAAAVSFVDELLIDFSSGDIIDSPPPPPPPGRRRHRHHQAAAAPLTSSEGRRLENPRSTPVATIIHPSLLDGPTAAASLDPFPALMEEELEWLSNKDAFPTLETFDIPSSHKPSRPPPTTNPKRPSPVSVLDGGFLTLSAAVAPPLTLRVPRRARSTCRRPRRLVLPLFRLPGEGDRRRCRHCQAEETPQWRAGPQGPKTLCNACGVRYKSGRLVPEYRPANSPSFSSELHSNSHRKIIEMQRMKERPVSATAAATMTKKKKRKEGLMPLL